MNNQVQPVIIALLRELPARGSQWSKREKQRFIEAFLAMLDFLYPVSDDASGK